MIYRHEIPNFEWLKPSFFPIVLSHYYIYIYTYIYPITLFHEYPMVYIYTIYAYVYTYVYIHTYIHPCMHACIHTYIFPCYIPLLCHGLLSRARLVVAGACAQWFFTVAERRGKESDRLGLWQATWVCPASGEYLSCCILFYPLLSYSNLI